MEARGRCVLIDGRFSVDAQPPLEMIQQKRQPMEKMVRIRACCFSHPQFAGPLKSMNTKNGILTLVHGNLTRPFNPYKKISQVAPSLCLSEKKEGVLKKREGKPKKRRLLPATQAMLCAIVGRPAEYFAEASPQ
jgi:hypothetical protein